MAIIAEGGSDGEETKLVLASLNNERAEYRVRADGRGTPLPSITTSGEITDGVERKTVGGNWTVKQTGGDGNLKVQAQTTSGTTKQKGSRFTPGKPESADPDPVSAEPTGASDERTTTQKEEKARDTVRSTRGEDPPVDPVKGPDDPADESSGSGETSDSLLLGGVAVVAFLIYQFR